MLTIPSCDPPAAPVAAARRVVLLVDDHPVVREPLARILRQHGYDVLVAGDGLEALAELAAGPVDAVVLDLLLPRMDGATVLAKIRANPAWSGVPVLVMTSMADGSMLRQVRATADHVLAKAAFDLDTLLRRIEAMAIRPAAARWTPPRA